MIRAISSSLVPLLVCVVAGAADAQAPGTAGAPAGSFAISSVRVFDGMEARDGVDVVVREGHIEAVGPDAGIPDDVPVVDGTGHTLLPALVDAHTHTFDPVFLEAALAFGVGLHLDMFSYPQAMQRLKEEQAAGTATHRAHILSAGFLATAPEGHGTQFGPVPTVGGPADADAWVEARAAEGADFVKIIVEDGRAHGLSMPTLEDATVAALIQAAHARGLQAVVHVSSLDDARMALAAGADGFAHVWVDRAPDAALVRTMRRTGAFVIATLGVLERLAGAPPDADLMDHPGIAPLLDAFARQTLGADREISPGASLDAMTESVRLLHAAGVPVLAGSDAPNPGTAMGAGVHRELALLVEAGLSPIEALRSATSVAAETFGLENVGRIRPGAPADLLLVEGDPTSEITHSRRIRRVWKAGEPFDHAAWRQQAAESR